MNALPHAKVWSGRLGQDTATSVERYTAAIDVDARLIPYDIRGSQAHAEMLQAVDLLSARDLAAITDALQRIADEVAAGRFEFRPEDEDIHTAVERRLIELAGDAGGRLHAGRSRNDQVVTALRLYAKSALRDLLLEVAALQDALVHCAGEHVADIIPGYTHMQRAQPISLGHHLLAYFEMLERDVERLSEAYTRCDVLVLGSGALAGSTLSLDRRDVAHRLGFSRVSANSLDAVSDRDFVLDISTACAMLMLHLSRFCEELVMWSSTEFGYVEIPDTHATGSSLMPQKKNPDVAELARARTGRVIGALTTLMVMLKGLPLAYNRDLQEDKPALFDAIDTTHATLQTLSDLIPVLDFKKQRMREAASDPALLATDVAEYLVLRGVAFREAHRIVGDVVRSTIGEGRTLRDVTLAEWQSKSPAFEADALDLFDIDAALKRRELIGGPGPRSVSHQLGRAIDLIDETRRRVAALHE
jgi:argininosuccinate lyase